MRGFCEHAMRRQRPTSTFAAGADAVPLWWTPFARSLDRLAHDVDGLRLIEGEGWLATHSSRMNAGERRVVDLTGIEPVTS
jgi:hypothetical protein